MFEPLEVPEPSAPEDDGDEGEIVVVDDWSD